MHPGMGQPITGEQVSSLIETGAGLTDTILDLVPGARRSQIERLSKREGALIRRVENARTAAERRAAQAELDGVRFQLRQAMQTAQAAQQPTTLVVEQRGTGALPWVIGGVALVAVVGGAVWLARRG